MWIELNGVRKQTNSTNLSMLCSEFEFDPLSVATALNGDFVPRDGRLKANLSEGDIVEVFAPHQGG